MNLEPRKLEEVMREVEEIEIREKRKIDPKIRPTVLGLRKLEIDTEYSCQGHKDRFPFPWVLIPSKDAIKTLVVTGQYNLQKRPFPIHIQWMILPVTYPDELSLRLLPRTLSEKSASLEELQRSAVDFGEFLQKLSPSELPMIPKRPKHVLKKLLPLSLSEAVICQNSSLI